jgi:hypothetical protein
LYYLAIVRYNKTDTYIRESLEPWFHGTTILLPFAIALSGFPLKEFNNPDGGICFAEPYNSPHCIGYEDGFIPSGFTIPCERGDGTGYREFP